MGTINSAFVLGHIGTAPDLNTTKAGHSVCTLSVATNRRTNPDDSTATAATWPQVKLWREQAEFAHRHLKVGDAVAIEGRLDLERWTDRDGNAKSRTVIVGRRVTLLGSPKRDQPAA